MKKLAIGIFAATILIAACGSSSKSSSGSGDKSTTTSGNSSGGNDAFSQLVAKAKTANYKVTYKTGDDSSSTVTYAQDGTGKISYTNGNTLLIKDGTSTISCDGTTSSAKCTELGSAGEAAVSGATSLFTTVYGALGSLSTAAGGDTSSQTIAGQDATCVTVSAANAGALGSVISKLAGNPSLTTCVQKDTGVVLKYTGTAGDTTKTVLEATEYGESSPSDFEPPSTPVTTPSIPTVTLPSGITLPNGVTIPGVTP
jgi:hypothetical protein